ncbi:MAG: hypothetical protein V7700_06700 [Halioglobus sp.]
MKYLTAIFLLVSSLSQAGENNEVDIFIESFYHNFSQRNFKKIAEEYFHKDAQFIFGEHIMVPGNATEIESVFLAIIDSLEKEDYQKSVVRSISKNYTGNTYVVATIYFDRFKNNKEKLDSMCSTYSIVKLAGSWKILAWFPSKPEKEDSCF